MLCAPHRNVLDVRVVLQSSVRVVLQCIAMDRHDADGHPVQPQGQELVWQGLAHEEIARFEEVS